MQLYGGFVNYEKCTFNIYVYQCTEDQEGNIILERSIPISPQSSVQMLEKRLFHNGTTRRYETSEGFVKYSKYLDELETWLNNYRDGQIKDLKDKLDKYESNPVKVIEL